MSQLSRKQLVCIPPLAAGKTIQGVAEECRISRRTIERWLQHDQRFCECLNAVVKEKFANALENNAIAIAELGELSVEALKGILSNPSQVSTADLLRASAIVQQSLLKIRELEQKHHAEQRSK